MTALSLITAAVAVACAAAATPFSLARALGDHMVLQRAPATATVWGFAEPGTTVKTVFQGNSYLTTAGSDTVWRQALPATGAGGPYNLAFSASTGETASLSDVLFGDVYLCGGQSNMQFSVPAVTNATQEAARANDYPNIRVFTVGQGTQSNTPLLDLATVEQNWSVASNMSIAWASNNGFGFFSAVCWLFGRNVYDGLGGTTPIGLVSNNWGGTPVEYWSDAAAFTRCNRTSANGILYNAMIAPYTVGPMAVTGATWYQGEANTGSQASADQYACLFPSMIQSWRANLQAPSMYFGFVQLSTWCVSYTGYSNDPISELRQAQLAALSLPKVGYGTNADHGAGCNIHPPPKQYCSARLANSALALQYGQSVAWRSPTYKSATVSGAGAVTVSLNDVTPAGLTLRAPANAGTVNCTGNPGQCGWAALQFNDPAATWVNATVAVAPGGQQLVLTAPPPAGATAPNASMYAWWPIPMMTAYLADPTLDLPVLGWFQPIAAAVVAV